MVFEASLSLPKSLSADVSVVCLECGRAGGHGQRGPCDGGCCFAGGGFFFWGVGVGGTLGSFVWASLRQTAVSLNISRVDIAGRCLGLALWSRSQCCGPYIEVWGDGEGWFPQALLPPQSKPRDCWRFHPNLVSLRSVFTFLGRVRS